MNTQEYLLSQLGEECAELAQMCSKSNRFGLDDVYDSVAKNPNAYNNRARLVEEINDLCGIIEELKERGILPAKLVSKAKVMAKRRKILKYLKHATGLGTVIEPRQVEAGKYLSKMPIPIKILCTCRNKTPWCKFTCPHHGSGVQ